MPKPASEGLWSFLDSGQIERGDVVGLSGLHTLGEAVETQVGEVGFGGADLAFPQAAVQGRGVGGLAPGGVLAHQGEENGVGREGLSHPVHHLLGLVQAAGE